MPIAPTTSAAIPSGDASRYVASAMPARNGITAQMPRGCTDIRLPHELHGVERIGPKTDFRRTLSASCPQYGHVRILPPAFVMPNDLVERPGTAPIPRRRARNLLRGR